MKVVRFRPEDSWRWLASASSSSNPHQSQIERKRKGEMIGPGSDDRYSVRRVQISRVDSKWRDVWDPKPGTGALFCPEDWEMDDASRRLFLRVEDVDKFKKTRAVWKSSKWVWLVHP